MLNGLLPATGIDYTLINGNTEYQVSKTPFSDDFSGDIVIPAYHLGLPVTAIANTMFSGAIITSVLIPNTIKTIGTRAFYTTTLTSITLPTSLTTIGDEAFMRCYGLTAISIPAGVTTLGSGIFYQCTGLTSLTLPSGLTSIGLGAIRFCSNLTTLTIPNGVTSIGDFAFYGDTKLTNITIPDSVTSIGYAAFLGCTLLSNVVVIPATPPTAGDTIFDSCAATLSIIVPAASEEAYIAAAGWITYAARISSVTTQATVNTEKDKITVVALGTLSQGINALIKAQTLVKAGYTVSITSSSNEVAITLTGEMAGAVDTTSNVVFHITKDGFTADTDALTLTVAAFPVIAGAPQIGKTFTSGSSYAQFNAVTADGLGNVYAGGIIAGTGSFNFGNSVTVTGKASRGIILVKYNSSGVAQWAKTWDTTPSTSVSTYIWAITADLAGNVYISGTIPSTTTVTQVYKFSSTISVTLPITTAAYDNLFVAKYNTSGTAQWATTLTAAGGGYSSPKSIVIDGNGDIIIGGLLRSDGVTAFDFGNSVTALTNYQYGSLFVVKYSSTGTALWAKTTTSTQSSQANGVAVDSLNNVYAAGYIYSTVTCDFGNSKTVANSSNTNNNQVLVKYSSAGVTQWAKTTVSGNSMSYLNDIAIDKATDSIYTVGIVRGSTVYNFGNTVTATSPGASNYNGILLKYDKDGVAQFAKVLTSPLPNTTASDSEFKKVAVDPSGNVYVSGGLAGSATYDFGNLVTAATSYAGTYTAYNEVLVKYNASGTAQWAKTLIAEPTGGCYFNGIAIDKTGSVWIAGYLNSTDTYNFGNSISLTGLISGNANPFLIQYK